MITCTLISPSDRALTTVFPKLLTPATKLATMPLIDKSSSAACAQRIWQSGLSPSMIESAIFPLLMIFAAATHFERSMKDSKSVRRNFFTCVVSAPARRSQDAASNVRTPVLTAKLLVSTVIPASSASASKRVIVFFSSEYCSISTISSQVEEA